MTCTAGTEHVDAMDIWPLLMVMGDSEHAVVLDLEADLR